MKRSILKSVLVSTGLLTVLKRIRSSFNWEFSYSLNGRRVKGLKLYTAKTENSEIWMGQLLKILMEEKSGTFVDVGVNVGQTLMQVKSLEPTRRYIGFEPNPSCNSFVEELIRINRFENVKLVPVGLYVNDCLLELDLYYDDITNSGGSVIKDYWAYKNIVPHRKMIVPLMCLSTINRFVPVDNVGIVKIDVEGAELEVLQSLSDVLSMDQPVVVIEILSAYSSQNKLRMERQAEILKITNSLNYAIFRIIEDKNAHLTGLQEIQYFDPDFNPNLCNYIFVHSSERERILSKFQILKL